MGGSGRLRQENHYQLTKAVYEVTDESGPHLRLWVDAPTPDIIPISALSPSEDNSEVITDAECDAREDCDYLPEASQRQTSLLWRLQRLPEDELLRTTECLDQ